MTSKHAVDVKLLNGC